MRTNPILELAPDSQDLLVAAAAVAALRIVIVKFASQRRMVSIAGPLAAEGYAIATPLRSPSCGPSHFTYRMLVN